MAVPMVSVSWTHLHAATGEDLDRLAAVYGVRRPESREERRRREAPLVALVNSPPEWADPNAWRAAVLAAEDAYRLVRRKPWLVDGSVASAFTTCMTLIYNGHEEPPSSTATIAMAAYRRAMTPVAKVAPERKTRGPALVCDSGWEDEW